MVKPYGLYLHNLYNNIAGKAFCQAHCLKVAELVYPTDLEEFLKSCCNETQTVDPNEFCKPMKQRVDEELKKITKLLENSSLNIKSATEAQGTSYLLRNRQFKNKNNFTLDGEWEDCNKLIIILNCQICLINDCRDTGTVMKLRRWSRGILATVRGGGHIEHFAPLYNSESPTQVGWRF